MKTEGFWREVVRLVLRKGSVRDAGEQWTFFSYKAVRCY